MKVIFLSKCSKFYVDFENSIKLAKDLDGFQDNCVWSFSGSFCQLWQGYMWSPVNVVKGGPKVSNPTNPHNTLLNLLDINITLA